MKAREFTEVKKAPNTRRIPKKKAGREKSVHLSPEDHAYVERIYLKRKLEGEESSIRSVIAEIIEEHRSRNEN